MRGWGCCMYPGSLMVLMCRAQVCWKWAKGLHDPEGLGGAHRVSGLLVLKRNVQVRWSGVGC